MSPTTVYLQDLVSDHTKKSATFKKKKKVCVGGGVLLQDLVRSDPRKQV